MPFAKPRGRPTRYPADYQHPPCLACGEAVERREGEVMSDWVGRRCCSRSCGSRASGRPRSDAAAERFAAAERNHPPCTECGAPVLHTRAKEPIHRYLERQTCGKPACSHGAKRRRMAEANAERLRVGLVVNMPDKEIKLDPGGVSFGGSFGRFDVTEGPRYGRVLSGAPLNRTCAGVVQYGR